MNPLLALLGIGLALALRKKGNGVTPSSDGGMVQAPGLPSAAVVNGGAAPQVSVVPSPSSSPNVSRPVFNFPILLPAIVPMAPQTPEMMPAPSASTPTGHYEPRQVASMIDDGSGNMVPGYVWEQVWIPDTLGGYGRPGLGRAWRWRR